MNLNRCWPRERKHSIGLISKKATLHVQHTFFLYISLPLFSTITTWYFQNLFLGTSFSSISHAPGRSIMCICSGYTVSVLHSHPLRIPTTTTYRIINHLMFIDTNICSNWSNYITPSETEQYNSSLRNLLIISRTMISLKNTLIRNSNFTIMLYSLLWQVVA